MKLNLLFCAILMVIVSNLAHAAFVNGRMIMVDCESALEDKQDKCRIYLAAIVDAQLALAPWNKLFSPNFCIPEEINLSELQGVFINYVKKGDDVLYKDAAVLARSAFSEAYPCESS